MELFNNIMWWLNIAIIILFVGLFFFQILFGIIFFLKPRQYPPARKLHHFTFIIRAKDEEDVIADSVRSCLGVDYPKDKLNVIVFAHNCTDKTAEIARKNGARVIEIHDLEKSHLNIAWSMRHGLDALIKDHYQTDYFLLLDADNQVDKNYVRACNDAADDGVILGRTFENSRNLTDSLISCMTGLLYIRDSRFACVSRSALHMGCVMNGPTSMIRSDIAYRWDSLTNTDDLEFTINRLLKDGMIVEYVNEAVVYEDQPVTMNDMFNRNTRLGNAINKFFWSTGWKCLPAFFKNLFKRNVPLGTKFTYFDQFTNNAIIPASLVAAVWFPIYYLYAFIYTGIVGPINIWGLGSYSLQWFTIFVVSVVSAALLIPFWIQPVVSYLTERKRLVVTNKKVLVFSLIFFPVFLLLEGAGIIKGFLGKSKWKKINRSHTTIKQ